MMARLELWMQARWQRLASYSLVRAMAWKLRVDRRRARPVAAGEATVDRRATAVNVLHQEF
jgi:hypothetical protein